MKTSYYLAQFDDVTNQAVIHDRLMLDTAQKGIDNAPPTYTEKENLTIQYSLDNAPRVERQRKRLEADFADDALKNVKPKSRGR